MAKVIAVCISEKKGTIKKAVNQICCIENYGIEGDAHAGKWHRQVSLMSLKDMEEFQQTYPDVPYGAYAENILLDELPIRHLAIGTLIQIQDVVLEVTQVGKECHSGCEIQKKTGTCIMPKIGVFTKVVHGGVIVPNDEVIIQEPFSVDTLSIEQIKQMRTLKFGICGAGALGQTVAEELVRLGANQIALFDEDEMTLHNCNRQIYANQTTLGQKKVQVAVQQLKRINPYGNYVGFEQMITVENGYDWLKDRDVIFDCVDDPKTKIELEELAKQLDIPLVHGAVNQWYGQVALVLPNDNLLKEIYKNCKKEKSNTNVMTVNMIASMQVAELCKWLELKCGNKQLRMLDVRKMELSTVSIK